MNLLQAIKMSAKSISSNKGRSILTMLGIIIGLAAVIILVSYAEGQNKAIQALYDSMGDNVIMVSAQRWGMTGPVDVSQDIYDYCLNLEGVAGVSPNGYIYRDPVIKYASKTLTNNRYSSYGGGMAVMDGGYGGEDTGLPYPQLFLGNDQYGLVNDYQIANGREMSYLEVEKLSQVCVLGAGTAESLFSFANPVGQTITVDGLPFRVVGVYESKVAGLELGNGEEASWLKDYIEEQDHIIVFPSTMTRYLNDNEPITDYMVKAESIEILPQVTTSLVGFLETLVGDEGYSYVDSPSAYQAENDEAAQLQQQFLGGIAAISLLVGGIGIMNIMLVTVTERTREIGIRKAIGAERRSIITQFLIEAAMICGIGGVIGILVGYLGTMIVTKLSFGLVSTPSAGISALAFGISVALGIIFGLYPAIKASALQPVDALRAD